MANLMVNTNISKSEKIVANTRVEKIVSKFEPPCIFVQFLQKVFTDLSNSVSTINLSFCPPRFETVASSDMLTPEAPMFGYKIIQSH